MQLHPHNIAQKTEVMVEHFHAVTRHKIGGRAKAMVVTGSRLKRCATSRASTSTSRPRATPSSRLSRSRAGAGRQAAGVDYTEEGMNDGLREKELPEKFATAEFQVLLVAEKYQTGFDQPLLHTMYVDKRLAGIQAVQTLSRLNRIHPLKEDTFVLDFVNDREEIREAFKTYYEGAEIGEEVEPARHVCDQGRTGRRPASTSPRRWTRFCEVYFKPKQKQSALDHQAMNAALDPAVSRLQGAQRRQRGGGGAMARQAAGVPESVRLPEPGHSVSGLRPGTAVRLPAAPLDQAAARVGAARLPVRRRSAAGVLPAAEDQRGLDRPKEGEAQTLDGPTEVGSGLVREQPVPLSQLIDVVNDRFGTDFNQADQLFFDQIVEAAMADDGLQQAAAVNPGRQV